MFVTGVLPNGPFNLTQMYLKCVVLVPRLPNHARTRLFPVLAVAFDLVRSICTSSHEQILDDLAASFARGRLQQSALRDVELHCLGWRHDEGVVFVGRVGGEEARGAVPCAGRTGEWAACACDACCGGVGVGFGGCEDGDAWGERLGFVLV